MVDFASTILRMSKVKHPERGWLPWLRTYPSYLDRSETDKENDQAGLKQYLGQNKLILWSTDFSPKNLEQASKIKILYDFL